MKQTSIVNTLLIAVVFFFFACNDPTNVGSVLLDEDRVGIEISENIPFETYTKEGDSVRTFSPLLGAQLRTYLTGTLDDPVFGIGKASLYAELFPQIGADTLQFIQLDIDSVRLVLPYDSTNVYGNHPEFYEFKVYQIAEDAVIDPESDYYSNQTFPINDTPIGSLEKTIDPVERFAVFNHRVDSFEVFPHLRIPIDNPDFINELSTNSNLFRDAEAFRNFFKGFYLESVQPNQGILAFDLFDAQAGLQVYYTLDSARVFTFGFTEESVKVINLEHQYETGVVQEYLDDKGLGQELVFVEAMAGVETVIEFPEIEEFKDKDIVINKAELEFAIARLPDDLGFAPIEQLLLSVEGNDGNLVLIQDVIGSQSSLGNSFGGVIIEGENGTPDRYRLNISHYLQDVLRGTINNRLFLTPVLSPQRANRVVLHGPDSSTHPAKLYIVYSEL